MNQFLACISSKQNKTVAYESTRVLIKEPRNIMGVGDWRLEFGEPEM